MRAEQDNEMRGRNGTMAPDEPSELRYYLGLIRRRLWIILVSALVIFTLGVLWVYRQVPVYRASARVMIEGGGSRVRMLEGGREGSSRDVSLENQAELITSRAVLSIATEGDRIADIVNPSEDKDEREGEQAEAQSGGIGGLWAEVTKTVGAVLGTEPEAPPRRPEPWEKLKGAISVRRVGETDVLSIEAENTRPQRAATFANGVADALIEYHERQREKHVSQAYRFLDEQKQKQLQKLEEAEVKLQRLRQDLNVLGEPSAGEDGDGNGVLEGLEKRLTEVRMEKLDLQAKMSYLQGVAEEPAESDVMPIQSFMMGLDDGEFYGGDLPGQVLEARRELERLKRTYGPEAPRIEVAREELASVEDQMDGLWKNQLRALESRLDVIQNKEAQLGEQYRKTRENAIGRMKESSEYARAKREVDRHEKLYDVLVERIREVDISSESPETRVEVTEKAVTPASPAKPDKFRMTLLVAFLGIMAGGGLAFVVDHVDNTIKTPEDMARYAGLPVLGFVPRVTDVPSGEDRFIYDCLISMKKLSSSASEAFREIRTNIAFSGTDDATETLVVTSAKPREGKTTCASNLALVNAQSGKKVLLVDADLRRPMIHKLAGVSYNPGMTSVLTGHARLEECMYPLDAGEEATGTLEVLPSGPIPPNPVEMLDSEAFTRFIEDVRDRYDRVVIDSPPVMVAADTSVLTARCDGVVFVVNGGETSRDAVRRSVEQLSSVDGRIIGGVLNNVKVSSLGYYYSDYYYYGYSRYYSDYTADYYERAERKG